MTDYPKTYLKPGKEAALQRKHPWIFSGAVRNAGRLKPGDITEVYSSGGKYLATAHYLGGSIALKILTFEQQEINDGFWKRKLAEAHGLRKAAGLCDNPSTNAYRLVHSEGDGLPGLIIDFYNGTAVIQSHSLGMHHAKPALVKALQEIYGDRLVSVYDKSHETMKSQTGINDSDLPADRYLLGDSGPATILETGHSFRVDWETGQKTGFFLDQRSNRMFAQYYSKGKKVLNCFCYSGAFSVYALSGGAVSVTSVDSSKQAIAWTAENMALNEADPSKHNEIAGDVKRFLTENDEKFDMIILDPPAFAKHHNITHNALQAYIHINARAMERLNPGGILFTFSCSQAVSRDMFQSAVMSAAIETGTSLKILHRLSQGSDHPVGIFHPEGEYLKGLICISR